VTITKEKTLSHEDVVTSGKRL